VGEPPLELAEGFADSAAGGWEGVVDAAVGAADVLSEARLRPSSAARGPLSAGLVIALATITEVASSEEATSRPKRRPVIVAAAAMAR